MATPDQAEGREEGSWRRRLITPSMTSKARRPYSERSPSPGKRSSQNEIAEREQNEPEISHII